MPRPADSIPAGEKFKFSRRIFEEAQPRWLSSFLLYCSKRALPIPLQLLSQIVGARYLGGVGPDTIYPTIHVSLQQLQLYWGMPPKNSPIKRTGYPRAQRLEYRTYHSTRYLKVHAEFVSGRRLYLDILGILRRLYFKFPQGNPEFKFLQGSSSYWKRKNVQGVTAQAYDYVKNSDSGVSFQVNWKQLRPD